MRGSRRLGAACGAALALALAPQPVRSGVEGSPHDLIAQGYDAPRVSPGQERCDRCHLAAGSPRPRPAAAAARQWGEVAVLCFSCHDGTTIVSAEVDASLTAFHPDAHGADASSLGDFDPARVGLGDLEAGRIECQTCHETHDNAVRPFLRIPLRDLCGGCHQRQVELGVQPENQTGNHPIGIDPAATSRPEAPLKPGADFTTPFPAPYPLRGGREATGAHWDLGGHLDEGGQGPVGCPTCHTVHGDEGAPPRASLLARAPVLAVADLFCEGCHAGERGDGLVTEARPNPGGTLAGRTYHPCDDDEANGTDRLPEVRQPEGWPLGGGQPARLVCTTCHRAHGARAGRSLLRPPVVVADFCEECHHELPLEHHHPTGADAAGDCAANVPLPPGGEPATLSCSHCHRAHNAGLGSPDELAYVPLLRQERGADAQCLPCHPDGNPTCSGDKDGLASHFLGDPGLAETYDDQNPPLRADPWPHSGLPSVYGGPEKTHVVCLSCHSFDRRAIVSGDKGAGRFLLARSGNPVEWEEGQDATYLCTGCHGENPGTKAQDKGHTHPMMNADIVRGAVEPLAPGSATPGGKVNCDSCHRPHGARTASGYYILESVGGKSTDPRTVHPDIDYTSLCGLCHSSTKY